MSSIENYRLLLAAAAACEDKKAEDIRILALDPNESGLTDYFLICNGTNDRQNVAITDEIEIRLKREFGVYPNSVEGRRQGEWILMDYVDFIVHVFSAEKRAFYGLERLRKSAVTVDTAQLGDALKAALKARVTDSRNKAAAKSEGKKAEAKKTGLKKAAEVKKTAGPKKSSVAEDVAAITGAGSPSKKSVAKRSSARGVPKVKSAEAKSAAVKKAKTGVKKSAPEA
jgi:ribosome-associated protein